MIARKWFCRSFRAGAASGLFVLAALTFAPMPAVAQTTAPEVFAPLPDAPEVNEARAKLGAMLFFDDRLSGDTSHSCASCHDPGKGWGTGATHFGLPLLTQTLRDHPPFQELMKPKE